MAAPDNFVPPFNLRVVQRAEGGLSARMVERWLRRHDNLRAEGPGALEQALEHQNQIMRNYNKFEVNRERREAEARGVVVVHDWSLPYSFVCEEIPDE
jgi:hypothetical protein